MTKRMERRLFQFCLSILSVIIACPQSCNVYLFSVLIYQEADFLFPLGM